LHDPSHGFRPGYAQLAVHPFLSFVDILDPGETVIVTTIGDAVLIHHSGEPFSSIEADLDGKGKPRLDSGAHPTELLIDPVMMEEQALAPTAHQVQFLFLLAALNVEPHAGFHTGHNRHQPVGDAVFGSDLAGELILVGLGRYTMGRFCCRAV